MSKSLLNKQSSTRLNKISYSNLGPELKIVPSYSWFKLNTK